jgi:hypothetical protein
LAGITIAKLQRKLVLIWLSGEIFLLELVLPSTTGEELAVHLGVVEARHRPAVQPEGARRRHEISALQ